LEFNLVREAKDNKKGIFQEITSKRKMRENEVPLLNAEGVLAIKDIEKVQLLNAAFASLFTDKTARQKPRL